MWTLAVPGPRRGAGNPTRISRTGLRQSDGEHRQRRTHRYGIQRQSHPRQSRWPLAGVRLRTRV